jgi:hypothetical protein
MHTRPEETAHTAISTCKSAVFFKKSVESAGASQSRGRLDETNKSGEVNHLEVDYFYSPTMDVVPKAVPRSDQQKTLPHRSIERNIHLTWMSTIQILSTLLFPESDCQDTNVKIQSTPQEGSTVASWDHTR